MTETNPQEFKGRKALITGSTGGIGFAIAQRLSASGVDLVLNYRRDKSKAENVVSELSGHGVKCLAIQADVAIPDDCKRLAKEAIEFLGGLDFLILNAGPFSWGTVEGMSEDEWRYLLESNYSYSFLMSQLLIPELRKSDYPSVIYIGGVASGTIYGLPNRAAYGAAKAALAILTRTVATEEGKHGIRSNMVCPGYIDVGNYSEEWKSKAVSEIPIGRIGTPEDIAPVVCYLLSKEAAYITGAILDAGGGLRM